MILNRITQQQHSHKKPTFLFRNERLRFDCKNPLLRVFLRRRKLLYASSSTYSLSRSLPLCVRAWVWESPQQFLLCRCWVTELEWCVARSSCRGSSSSCSSCSSCRSCSSVELSLEKRGWLSDIPQKFRFFGAIQHFLADWWTSWELDPM